MEKKMTYYTKIIFGIDAELHDKIFIGMKFDENESNRKVLIEFDTGEKYIFDKNDDILFLIGEILEIPEQATKITIICENNLKQFGWNVSNPAIVSIEHFESNCLTDLTNAFCGFVNVREFKHFDVTSKVTEARSMCSGWKNFNDCFPESFCSIFEYLENADYMFSNWNSFNQPLPERFFSNIKNLVYVISMFNNWKSFNQPLPEGFFCNTKKLKSTSYMFSNWNSFNQPLPEGFFADTKNLKSTILMFYGWNSYEHDLPQYFINIINKLKKSNNYVCCGWYKNNQVSNDFKYKDIFIKDYKEEDIFFLKDNYFDEIQNLILISKLKNDTKVYHIKEKDLTFVIHNGIFMFPIDVYFKNKIDIEILNMIFENNIMYKNYINVFDIIKKKDKIIL